MLRLLFTLRLVRRGIMIHTPHGVGCLWAHRIGSPSGLPQKWGRMTRTAHTTALHNLQHHPVGLRLLSPALAEGVGL
jgi:hypothetical protein